MLTYVNKIYTDCKAQTSEFVCIINVYMYENLQF